MGKNQPLIPMVPHQQLMIAMVPQLKKAMVPQQLLMMLMVLQLMMIMVLRPLVMIMLTMIMKAQLLLILMVLQLMSPMVPQLMMLMVPQLLNTLQKADVDVADLETTDVQLPVPTETDQLPDQDLLLADQLRLQELADSSDQLPTEDQHSNSADHSSQLSCQDVDVVEDSSPSQSHTEVPRGMLLPSDKSLLENVRLKISKCLPPSTTKPSHLPSCQSLQSSQIF